MVLRIFKGRSFSREFREGSKLLLKSWQFYAGVATLLAGMQLNFVSQTYLFNAVEEGRSLPGLSDLILDNIPYINVSLYYDLLSLLVVLLIGIYIVYKNEYRSFPFFLLLCGIFYITRGVFIVLTPLGNPPLFSGSSGPFKGFSKFELGVYPSGHVGATFLFLLLMKDKMFKWLISVTLLLIIITLFLARGHYSIDVFSGILFAYAIKSFGDKYFTNFNLPAKKENLSLASQPTE